MDTNESKMARNIYNALDISAPASRSNFSTNWQDRKPSMAIPVAKKVRKNPRVEPEFISISKPAPSAPVPTVEASSSGSEEVKNSFPSGIFDALSTSKPAKKLPLDEEPEVDPEFSQDNVDKELLAFLKNTMNKIMVVGVGGGGSNAVNRLALNGVRDAITVAANTDARHLFQMKTKQKLILGKALTMGNGAGNDPVIGEAAAEESEAKIRKLVKGIDLVFVTAGLGGGTGTGAAPVIANIAREEAALVVGVCTLPFQMEGDVRINHAFEGLKKLYDACDTVIVIPNEKLLKMADIPVEVAFEVVDEVLIRAVKGILQLVLRGSTVNVDMADIRQVLKQGGTSVIGLAEASGENRVINALYDSLSQNLLEVDIANCKGALIHITCGPDLFMGEIDQALRIITEEIGKDSQIIWGTDIDPSLEGKVQVTTVLSGVESPFTVSLPSDEEPVAQVSELESLNLKRIWDNMTP